MAELLPHEARRRTKTGRVVSNKMQKTVVVVVESMRQHRLYGRNVRRTKKFKAHDEENRCQVGDVVVISESRPISKEKRWVVREIVKETIGPGLEVLAEEEAVARVTGPESGVEGVADTVGTEDTEDEAEDEEDES
jgi:small subunit ribosomal protein S17